MVPYYGDFADNATVYIPINTFDSNDPAASVTVTNLVSTDVHIHKDGGTAQRNNAAGITMTVDFDLITGNHMLIIDTSDNTVADFWEAGHEYQVRIEGATVDGGTINAWVGSFSIERAGGVLALIKSATYGLSALKTLLDTTGIKVASFADNAITAASINADAITNAKIADNAIAAENLAGDCITSAKIADNAFANEHFANGALTSTEITSAGGCVIASIANDAITAASINTGALTADAFAADAIVAATLATGCLTADAFAANAIVAATLAGDCITNAKIADNAIAAENIAADAITAAKIANGAIDNATFAADVGSTAYATNIIALAARKAIDEYDPPTNAEMEARTIAAADYTVVTDLGVVQTGDNFAIVNGDHGLVSIQDDIDAILVDTGELQTDWHDGGRLDLLLDGASAPSAAAVADAVWDEALAGHLGAGTTGNALNAAGSAGDPWSTLIPGEYGAGTAGLLLGTTIPNAIDAIDNYLDTELAAITGAVITNAAGTDIAADIIALKLVADTIQADTDLLDDAAGGLADIHTDIGTLTTEVGKIPKSDSNVSWNATALGAIQSECTDALNAYDPPTNAEFELRTLPAADYTVVSDLGTVQTGDAFARLGAPAGESVSADIAAIKAETATIVADTNELQVDDYPTSIAAVKTVVDAIQAKTDDLTFTAAGQVDANVQSVNDVALTGDGSATPWGPA